MSSHIIRLAVWCGSMMTVAATAAYAADEPTTQPGAPPAREYAPAPFLLVVPLTHTEASAVVDAVQPPLKRLNEDLRIVADADRNAVLLSGKKADVELALRLLRQVDALLRRNGKPQPPADASLDLTIYELALPTKDLASLTAESLKSHTASPGVLLKHLATLGEARIAQRAEQRIALDRPTILTNGGSAPFVRSAQKTAGGQRNMQIEYQDVGSRLKIEPGTGFAGDTATISFSLEMSSMQPTKLKGDEIAAPLYLRFSHRFDGAVAAGQPIVLLGSQLDSTNPDRSWVSVARVLLTP